MALTQAPAVQSSSCRNNLVTGVCSVRMQPARAGTVSPDVQEQDGEDSGRAGSLGTATAADPWDMAALGSSLVSI